MRFISIILLFFILLGCSKGEPVRLAEQSQTPDIIGNGTPAHVAVTAQSPVVESDEKPVVIKGGELCEAYLLKKIALAKAEGSQTVKQKTFNADDETLSPELKKWLQTSIHMEMLVTFELRYKEKKALILRANDAGATGIGANFENWFIQLDSRSINFRSLSDNPELIFLDKNGLLNYYSIDYGNKFLKNRDWDNLTLDLLLYRINPNGESQLVSEERNVKCE